jgi:hypothetical protein
MGERKRMSWMGHDTEGRMKMSLDEQTSNF